MSGHQGNEPFNDFIETVQIGTRFWNILSPDVILTYDSRTRSKLSSDMSFTLMNRSKFLSCQLHHFRFWYKSKGGSMYIITRIKGTHRTDAILPFQIVVTKFILWKIFYCELKFQKVIIVIVLEVLRVESNTAISYSSQSSKIVFVFSFRGLQRTQLVDLAKYREGLYPLRQRP